MSRFIEFYSNVKSTFLVMNRSDIEQLNATELQKLCPIGKIGIECIDEKGEAFDSSKGPAGKFTAYCDLTFGMFCQPVDKTTDTCPDFKVRYSCKCDPTTTVSQISGNFKIIPYLKR